MPRRERPAETQRSEHWLRIAVNERPDFLNAKISEAFGWSVQEKVQWLSPVRNDDYAEYFDQSFLDRLGVSGLKVPLHDFWPASGPRWDGLAKTSEGKVVLLEAKAHIDESVDFRSKASGASITKIGRALALAKKAFAASEDSPWEAPFYQYANRLAHLHFLCGLNGVDAYLLFLYFADAPDVPVPCSAEQWKGAIRLTQKCLGLGAHPYRKRIAHVIMSVGDMLSNPLMQPTGRERPAAD